MTQLTADLVEAFAGTFLSPRYDKPVATPDFHRAGWELYCSDHPQVDLAAPRDHAKSTAFTFVYSLAEMCFRISDYEILIGSTEENAAEQLSNIREELAENDDLRREFGIHGFEKDSTTDIIVKCDDGHRFRILARGAEQKIRGKMWNGKRPNLIVCDDMEDDEQVENKDRRAKFRRWFFRAAKQALSRSGKIRVHGTILHEDALLARLQKNKTWGSLFYKAHKSFDDFSGILWPDGWTEERLRARRQEFIEDGDSGGYSQEFLNDPQDNVNGYLRREDFLPMALEEFEEDSLTPRTDNKVVCAAADFAISKADSANRTSFSIGGKDIHNLLHFIDQRVDRWDQWEIIEEMFAIQQRWRPDLFFVEGGQIWKGISAIIYREMQARDIWINIQVINPVKDKAIRGRSLQRRMRAGGCQFHKKASWYAGFENELIKFTGNSQATLDDQFDSAALLSKGFEEMQPVEQEDLIGEDEQEFEYQSHQYRSSVGRSAVTGY